MGHQVDNLEHEIADCDAELLTDATGEQFEQQMQESMNTVKKFRATLRILQQTADDLNKNWKPLYDRGQNINDSLHHIA
jgi:hypothetical protein